MKNVIVLILYFSLSNNVKAQPWKLTRDFSLAFKSNYDDFRIEKYKKADKIYCAGYEKSDSLKKILQFELFGNDKDGWFNRLDPMNKDSYSICFKRGVAKKLSYTNTDSLVFSFTIDSNLLNGVHTVYYANGKIREYGYYKNNARIGEWSFFNNAGNIISMGTYSGDYNRLLYDSKKHILVTLNRYLDTTKVETLAQEPYDNLKRVLKQWGIAFPVQLQFKTGKWQYFDDAGKLTKEEFYEKGKLIRTENGQKPAVEKASEQ